MMYFYSINFTFLVYCYFLCNVDFLGALLVLFFYGKQLGVMFITASIAVKRLGQFFILFRDISFTVKWKHEQGYI